MKIGDFVTAYSSGYWQLIDRKPKIAFDDYEGFWKKGDNIGELVILKKAFTNKMKPRIDFTYEDSRWLKPISAEILAEIEGYFAQHPEYKQKFDNAPLKLRPGITNCWFDLPTEEEEAFREALKSLPEKFTLDMFWKTADGFQKYVSSPPTNYLMNFAFYPWDLDDDANALYSGWELLKNE